MNVLISLALHWDLYPTMSMKERWAIQSSVLFPRCNNQGLSAPISHPTRWPCPCLGQQNHSGHGWSWLPWFHVLNLSAPEAGHHAAAWDLHDRNRGWFHFLYFVIPLISIDGSWPVSDDRADDNAPRQSSLDTPSCKVKQVHVVNISGWVRGSFEGGCWDERVSRKTREQHPITTPVARGSSRWNSLVWSSVHVSFSCICMACFSLPPESQASNASECRERNYQTPANSCKSFIFTYHVYHT